MGYGFNADKSKHEIYQIKKKTITFEGDVATYGEISNALLAEIKDICEKVVKVVENVDTLRSIEYRIASSLEASDTLKPYRVILGSMSMSASSTLGLSEARWLLRKTTSSEEVVKNTLAMSPERWGYDNVALNCTARRYLNTETYVNGGHAISFDIYYYDEIKTV